MNDSRKFQRYFLQHDRGWVFSLMGLVSLVYLPFLGSPFVFDDISFFLSGGAANNYASTLFDLNLRWLPYASLGWTADIFSDAVPHFFHLGNLILHVGNVIILFYFLRSLLGAVVNQPEQKSSVLWGSWLAAGLFAAHPVAVYAVGYIIQRSILMATFFALLMQWSYLRALLSGQKRWLLLAVFAYFLAGFSKEHSVLTPALLLAIHLLLRTSGIEIAQKLSRRALWFTWCGFIAIGIFLVLRAKGGLGVPYEPMAAFLFEQQGQVASTPLLHVLSAFTQGGLFFKYLFLWLVPNPEWMSVDMREHFISSLNDWQGWVGVLFFILYGVLAFRLMLRGKRKALLGFALLYPWLQFGVEFTGVRVQEPFVLYRSYLWLPGMFLLIPLLLINFEKRKVMLLVGILVLLFVPLSWNRLWVFGDNYRLWNDAAVLLPEKHVTGADRIYFNRGQANAVAHKWEEAIVDFKVATEISPQLALLHYQLGMAYLNQGDGKSALGEFEIGHLLEPKEARYYLGKGLALMRLHQSELAQEPLKKGCDLGEQMACMIMGFAPQKK